MGVEDPWTQKMVNMKLPEEIERCQMNKAISKPSYWGERERKEQRKCEKEGIEVQLQGPEPIEWTVCVPQERRFLKEGGCSYPTPSSRDAG